MEDLEKCIKCSWVLDRVSKVEAKAKGVSCIVADSVPYCPQCKIVYACAECPVPQCEINPA